MRRYDFSNFVLIFQYVYLKFDRELGNKFTFVRQLLEFKKKLSTINI